MPTQKFILVENPSYSTFPTIESIEPNSKVEYTGIDLETTYIHIRNPDKNATNQNVCDLLSMVHYFKREYGVIISPKLSDCDDYSLKTISQEKNIPIDELIELKEIEKDYREKHSQIS